jgi:tetratricopeptide (TPR) repeat protein
MPLELLGRYVMLLIAPLKLCPDYGGSIIGSAVRLSDPYLYVGALCAVGGIIALVIAMRRRGWTLLLCLFSFALLFGMVSNLLTIIGVNFADRLMYVPSVFFCIAVAMLAARLPRRALLPLMILIVLLMSARTTSYAWEWNDRLRFYRYTTAQWPQSVRLRLLLAEELAERGELDSAQLEIARARQLQPDYYKVWIRSATIAMQAGKLEEALLFARRAHNLQPSIASQQLITEIRRRHFATQPSTQP